MAYSAQSNESVLRSKGHNCSQTRTVSYRGNLVNSEICNYVQPLLFLRRQRRQGLNQDMQRVTFRDTFHGSELAGSERHAFYGNQEGVNNL